MIVRAYRSLDTTTQSSGAETAWMNCVMFWKHWGEWVKREREGERAREAQLSGAATQQQQRERGGRYGDRGWIKGGRGVTNLLHRLDLAHIALRIVHQHPLDRVDALLLAALKCLTLEQPTWLGGDSK